MIAKTGKGLTKEHGSPRRLFGPSVWTHLMDTSSATNLLLAAAQGEQAKDPRHVDGSIFTGPDPSVQASQDAVHHFVLAPFIHRQHPHSSPLNSRECACRQPLHANTLYPDSIHHQRHQPQIHALAPVLRSSLTVPPVPSDAVQRFTQPSKPHDASTPSWLTDSSWTRELVVSGLPSGCRTR